MPLSRSYPQFTVRRLMVAVAIAALFVYGGLEISRLWKLSLLYRNEAKMWAKAERKRRADAAFSKTREIREPFRTLGTTPFGQSHGGGLGPRFSDRSRDVEARADWCARHKLAFERAALHPWLPVWPDPPRLKSGGSDVVRQTEWGGSKLPPALPKRTISRSPIPAEKSALPASP